MYKITAITSIYKASDFIKGFMDDILKQTAFDQCQWLLLDGDSPEDEFSIIEPYLEHENIKYERASPDPGLYSCWNKMIEQADSEYITNANVDDRLFPECIEKHIKALDENPDADVAYCENIMTNVPNDTFENYKAETPVRVFPEGGGPFFKPNMLSHNYPHNHPVWRKSLHDRFGMFNDYYISAADYEFWMRCLRGGANDFLYIPEILGIYYHNPSGVSTKVDVDGIRTQQEMEIKLEYSGYFMGELGTENIKQLIERLGQSGRLSQSNINKIYSAVLCDELVSARREIDEIESLKTPKEGQP
jgi:glycosyltransferase involved in cell wall biosynthesis